jgi:hypothetical protein
MAPSAPITNEAISIFLLFMIQSPIQIEELIY